MQPILGPLPAELQKTVGQWIADTGELDAVRIHGNWFLDVSGLMEGHSGPRPAG
jgi:hypothetical protein